jgi:hypothetical protein
MSELICEYSETMSEIICEISPKLRWNEKTQNAEMRHCAFCDSETPYLFHAGAFLAYRKCAKCMDDHEREAVRRLYKE